MQRSVLGFISLRFARGICRAGCTLGSATHFQSKLIKFYCLAGEQEGMFRNLRQLQRLDLANNVISSIEPRVFDESANLTSLTDIDLSHNQLTELEPWPLIRAQHRRSNVILNNNRITNFTNALRWSFDCNSTRVFETRFDVGANEIRHITDAIRSWNIDGKQALVELNGLFWIISSMLYRPP